MYYFYIKPLNHTCQKFTGPALGNGGF